MCKCHARNAGITHTWYSFIHATPDSHALPCFPDFRGKGGYTSLPPGGRSSSTVLYPGPPSYSPRPPTLPFSCLSRCNHAISYVVFLSFSSPLLVNIYAILGSRSSFIRSTCPAAGLLPTSSDSSPIFPSNTSPYANLLSQLVHPPPVHSLHSSNTPHPVVFTHLQSMLVTLWCFPDTVNVSRPYNIAGVTHAPRTFPFNFFEMCLSDMTPSTCLHAFAPACTLLLTSVSDRPSLLTAPPDKTVVLSYRSPFQFDV